MHDDCRFPISERSDCFYFLTSYTEVVGVAFRDFGPDSPARASLEWDLRVLLTTYNHLNSKITWFSHWAPARFRPDCRVTLVRGRRRAVRRGESYSALSPTSNTNI